MFRVGVSGQPVPKLGTAALPRRRVKAMAPRTTFCDSPTSFSSNVHLVRSCLTKLLLSRTTHTGGLAPVSSRMRTYPNMENPGCQRKLPLLDSIAFGGTHNCPDGTSSRTTESP